MRPVRLELTAPRLKGGCSTTELRAQKTEGLNPASAKPDLFIISKNQERVQLFFELFYPRILRIIYYSSFSVVASKNFYSPPGKCLTSPSGLATI